MGVKSRAGGEARGEGGKGEGKDRAGEEGREEGAATVGAVTNVGLSLTRISDCKSSSRLK